MTIVDRILMEAELEEQAGQAVMGFLQKNFPKATRRAQMAWKDPERFKSIVNRFSQKRASGTGMPLGGPGVNVQGPPRPFASTRRVEQIRYGKQLAGKYGKHAAVGAGGLALGAGGLGMYHGVKRITGDTQGYV